jgi:TolB protein
VRSLTPAGVSDGSPAWSPDGSTIAVDRFVGGHWQLFLLSADGGSTTQLTQGTSDVGHPSWSPDGKQLVYSLNRAGNFDVYLINADGSGARALRSSAANEWWPAWSPDGTTIAYVSDELGGVDSLFGVSPQGGAPRKLAYEDFAQRDPAWTPDGSLLYATHRDVNGEIFIANADGSAARQLTNRPVYDFAPSISPDGRRIAFTSVVGDFDRIVVMRSNGSGVRQLSPRLAVWDEFNPRWSPDGKRILFSSTRYGQADLFLMDANGAHRKRITSTGLLDEVYADWSPDGKRIAITVANAKAKYWIDIVNADGKGRRTLVKGQASDAYHPSWSPDGRRIAFIDDVTGQRHVYVIGSNGIGFHQVTSGSTNDDWPAWSPDGRLIAFTRLRGDGGSEIDTVGPNGSGPDPLVRTDDSTSDPAWSWPKRRS